MASKRNGTLYIGVTGNLKQRVWGHKHSGVPGFSSEYGTHRLVYFEMHGEMQAAILREKRLKKWRRKWKLALIEGSNPYWRDLFKEICG